MIIDFHTHPTQNGVMGVVGRLEKYMGSVNLDTSMDTLIDKMDHGGIDKCVLLPYGPTYLGINPNEVPNSWVAEQVTKHPDRIIGFAGIDVHAKDAAVMLEKDIRRYNLKGLKIHGDTQEMAVNDSRLNPIYEMCLELRIPVVHHAGEVWECLGKLNRTDPVLFDDFASNYPDLTIVMSHAGSYSGFNIGLEKALMVCAKNKNIYLEMSYASEEFYREALIRLGPSRLLFASDFPFQNPSWAAGKAQLILNHFLQDMPGLISDRSMVDMIMGGNAAKILGLKN